MYSSGTAEMLDYLAWIACRPRIGSISSPPATSSPPRRRLHEFSLRMLALSWLALIAAAVLAVAIGSQTGRLHAGRQAAGRGRRALRWQESRRLGQARRQDSPPAGRSSDGIFTVGTRQHHDPETVRRLSAPSRIQRAVHADAARARTRQQRRLLDGQPRASGSRFLQAQAQERRLRRDLQADHPVGECLQAAASVADLRRDVSQGESRARQGQEEGPS